MAHLTISVRIWSVRAMGARRSLQGIARAEPVWLIVVVAFAVWGLVLGVPRLLQPDRPWMPAAAVVLLATLLEATRADERLVTLLGGRFSVVRFVDAALWLSPLLAFLAVRSPVSALMAVLGIGGVALVPTVRTARSGRAARSYPSLARLVSLGAVEWAAGLRRAPWLLVGSTLVGVIGPAHPLAIAAGMVTACVTATAYHWAPGEGWLLIDVARRSPRSYLWHKVGVSCGLLALALGAILASAVIRVPSLALVFTAVAVGCLHAHVCGILCRYAEYEEKAPLSAGGTLIWFVSSALLVVPPAALVTLYLLHRRAVRRLAPYCRSAPGDAR